MRYEQWESNGEKRNRLRVHADRVQFLDRVRRGADGAGATAPAKAVPREETSQPPTVAADEAEPPAGGKADSDDLPF